MGREIIVKKRFKHIVLVFTFVMTFFIVHGDTCFGMILGNSSKDFVSFGINTGAYFHSDGNFFNIGGEISFGHTEDEFWYGLYIDGVYTPGIKDFRLSIGPEFGILCLGFDGGLLYSSLEHEIGFTVRFLLSFVFIHPYIRFNVLSETTIEVGCLLKFPFIE